MLKKLYFKEDGTLVALYLGSYKMVSFYLKAFNEEKEKYLIRVVFFVSHDIPLFADIFLSGKILRRVRLCIQKQQKGKIVENC